MAHPAGLRAAATVPVDASLPPAAAPWEALWRSGVLHSCAIGIRGNYDQEILAFWRQRFAGLADGQVLVDVGTGNGAIALLAQQAARERGIALQIHGVDLADIDPPRDVPRGAALYEGIRFHPRTAMTHMPFADGAVALLCSQFAFEYAPHAEAAAEILRVIGPQGRAAFIVHSAESVIAEVGRTQLDACGWLLQTSGVLPATTALATAMAGATAPALRAALARDPAAEAARRAFNAEATTLMDRIESQPAAQVLQQTAQRIARLLAEPARTRDEAAAKVAGLRRWIEDEKARLALMQAAMLDRAALEHVVGLLGATGLPVQSGRLVYGGSVAMGWTIDVGQQRG